MAQHKSLRRLAGNNIPKKVAKAAEVVVARQKFIQSFADFDDFIFRGGEADSNASAAVEHNLCLVRAHLARTLWSNEVFIGIDVIDRILFDLVATGQAETLIQSFLSFVQERGIHRAGFVLYPLHSFGVLGLGFYRFFRGSLPLMTLPEAGVCITAQNNKKEDMISFLEHARTAFEIRQRLPLDAIEHFTLSRPLKWIERNPLLAVRVRSFTASYYENQFVYMLKLRISTALIMMLSVMEDREEQDSRLLQGSSARVNNWQTLDIKHYLTFEAPVGRRSTLSSYCVPMNAARLELAHLSDLNVDIDPTAWTKERTRRRLASLNQTLSAIERGFFSHSTLSTGSPLKGRVYRKLLTSIDAFRRSLSASFRHTESTVSLAIAFETLLTDHYAPRSTERILRRVQICLRGVRGTRAFQAAVQDLFECRGAIVHQGEDQRLTSARKAYQAYVLCLQHVVARLSHLPAEAGNPIAIVLGD